MKDSQSWSYLSAKTTDGNPEKEPVQKRSRKGEKNRMTIIKLFALLANAIISIKSLLCNY